MIRILLIFFLVTGYAFGDDQEKGCNTAADIVFVLDESGSIHPPEFRRQIAFLREIIGSFEVGFNRTHIGVETFATDCQIRFHLGQYTTGYELEKAVNDTMQRGGNTRTDLALKLLCEEMFSPRYIRPWVRQVAIIITDGESSYPLLTEKEAKLCHQKNYKMLAIGVGTKVKKSELEAIASSNDLVFNIRDYGALDSLRQMLASLPCKTPTTPAPPTTATTEPQCQKTEDCLRQQKMDNIWSISDQAGVDETDYAIDFIKSMTEKMDIDPLHVQVGLAPRFCDEGITIRLKDHDTKEGLWRDLDRRRLTGVRSDRIIEYIRRQGMSPLNGARSDAVKVGVLIVDNTEVDWENTVSQATLTKQERIRLLIIGVGSRVDQGKLRELASSSEDYFYASSYSQLQDLKSNIIQRLCTAITKTGRRDWPKRLFESLYDY